MIKVIALEHIKTKKIYMCKLHKQDACSDRVSIYPEGYPNFIIEVVKDALLKRYKIIGEATN